MSSLEKIAHLASEGRFDSLGSENSPDMQKVSALGEGTRYDVCTSSSTNRKITDREGIGSVLRSGLCHSFTPDGRCVSLFKTLYTNACSHECRYCGNSSSCASRPKVFSYSPEELAKITLLLYKGNYIEGLFLSSGIAGDEDSVMDEMIDSVRLLRTKYRFNGYIHLKVLPGASKEHIKQAMELVDRVSINIEAPSKTYLDELSPTKDYQTDILQRQRMIRDLSRQTNLPSGQTTQMVVGAGAETDKEIFDCMRHEYDELKLKRVYFSAFTPLKGTCFSGRNKQPVWRENRLYQMDWLYRVYKFSAKEVEKAFDEDGRLPDSDPKVMIAKQTIDSPVDINEADYDQLIKIPGVGKMSAFRVLSLRKRQRIVSGKQLQALGVRVNRARPYLKLNGWHDTNLMEWLT